MTIEQLLAWRSDAFDISFHLHLGNHTRPDGRHEVFTKSGEVPGLVKEARLSSTTDDGFGVVPPTDRGTMRVDHSNSAMEMRDVQIGYSLEVVQVVQGEPVPEPLALVPRRRGVDILRVGLVDVDGMVLPAIG